MPVARLGFLKDMDLWRVIWLVRSKRPYKRRGAERLRCCLLESEHAANYDQRDSQCFSRGAELSNFWDGVGDSDEKQRLVSREKAYNEAQAVAVRKSKKRRGGETSAPLVTFTLSYKKQKSGGGGAEPREPEVDTDTRILIGDVLSSHLGQPVSIEFE